MRTFKKSLLADLDVPSQSKARFYQNKALVIGWREWVGLPELGVDAIKAKIDTGARTSALHAFDIKERKKGRKWYVDYKIHPIQRNSDYVICATSELVDKRLIRDSGGKATLRPVIHTQVYLGPLCWTIEITLTARDKMGFRMLLGRQAVREHLMVHPGKSFVLGKKHYKSRESM